MLWHVLIGIDVLFSTVAGDAIARTRPMSSIVSGEQTQQQQHTEQQRQQQQRSYYYLIMEPVMKL